MIFIKEVLGSSNTFQIFLRGKFIDKETIVIGGLLPGIGDNEAEVAITVSVSRLMEEIERGG